MVTDEERRGVAAVAAARLRGVAENSEGVAWIFIEKYLGLVPDERFVGGSVYTSDSVLRLADLIEPEPERTSRMELIDTGERLEPECGEKFLFCDRCGEVGIYLQANEDGDYWCDAPVFCPNCGSKVVG